MRTKPLFLLAMLAVSGCMSEDVLRYDGVTTSAGDAIAANTAMQMVDPWPAGVEDTRLRVPAERPARAGAAAGEASGDDASEARP